MSRFTVIVTDDRYGSYREEENVLRKVDAQLFVYNLSTEEETIRAVKDADGLLVNLHILGRRVIESMTRCRIISRYGVGYDNVDVAAATRKGIWVSRVTDYCLEDVSDQAIALLLGCVRKVAYKDRKVREGRWNLQKDQPCRRIAGRTFGLLGYGAIARFVHRKLSGFGLSRVLVHDPFIDDALIQDAGGVPVDLPTLLRESDYLSIHVPLSDDTRKLIGEKEISLMKKGVILINTSRGPILDEPAVIQALKDGRMEGAGLDVFETEPLPADSPFKSLDNVVLSDHTGWYSEESLVELKTKAAQNVAAVLAGGKPVTAVNTL